MLAGISLAIGSFRPEPGIHQLKLMADRESAEADNSAGAGSAGGQMKKGTGFAGS